MPKQFAIIPDSDFDDDSMTARLIAQNDQQLPLESVSRWNSALDYDVIVRTEFTISSLNGMSLSDDASGEETPMYICRITRDAGS
jgi:hypothetical protein